MARTTTDLLNNIKRRTQLPDDGGTLADTDILALASDELQNVVAPRLMAIHEWHYAFTYTQTVTSSRTYRINSRCAGNKIISIEYFDGTNYRFINQRHPLTQNKPGMSAEDFSIYGNQIVLSDGCPTSGTLRIRAILRPSSLVTTGCTSITSIGDFGATNQLTVTSSSGFSSTQLIDVQFATSPYEIFMITSVSSVPDGSHVVTVDSITSSTFPVSSNSPGRLCPAEQTDYPQLPDELHDYLAQRTAIRCMEARGMTSDMQNHIRKLEDLETSFSRLMSPRANGEFKVIAPEDYFFSGRP